MFELLWRRVVRSVSVLSFVPVRTAESICCFRVRTPRSSNLHPSSSWNDLLSQVHHTSHCVPFSGPPPASINQTRGLKLQTLAKYWGTSGTETSCFPPRSPDRGRGEGKLGDFPHHLPRRCPEQHEPKLVPRTGDQTHREPWCNQYRRPLEQPDDQRLVGAGQMQWRMHIAPGVLAVLASFRAAQLHMSLQLLPTQPHPIHVGSITTWRLKWKMTAFHTSKSFKYSKHKKNHLATLSWEELKSFGQHLWPARTWAGAFQTPALLAKCLKISAKQTSLLTTWMQVFIK